MNEGNNPEEGKLYYLTKNVINKNQLLGINKRNWAEAAIWVSGITLIVTAIPFTKIVTQMTLIVLLPIAFLLNLKGIKHRSLSEMVVAEINFRNNRRRLHLRGPEYVRKKYKTTYTESEDESLAEQHYKLLKQGLSDFVEKYASDEDSK